MADLNNTTVATYVADVLTDLLLSPDASTWTFANAVDVASGINDLIGSDTVNGIVGRFDAVAFDDGRVAVNYVVNLDDN